MSFSARPADDQLGRDDRKLADVGFSVQQLGQALDAGTAPPEVMAILDKARRWNPACKLLGAGGGGYLLMLADDPAAAAGIRAALTESPPNGRARFVTPSVSSTGLQITRS